MFQYESAAVYRGNTFGQLINALAGYGTKMTLVLATMINANEKSIGLKCFKKRGGHGLMRMLALGLLGARGTGRSSYCEANECDLFDHVAACEEECDSEDRVAALQMLSEALALTTQQADCAGLADP